MRNNTYRNRAVQLAIGVSSVALMAAAAPSAAFAQAAAPAAEPVEELVVTGFRKSLFDALETKKNSKEIVEAISAEDIGKLPDNSIAESLARLPGLTSQRVDGRSQTISLRGLGPDFTMTLLNGREQVSTSNNRSAEFDQYPSELISNVKVYKSSAAGVVGQGLAGTVDLRTIRPLEQTSRILAVAARGEMTSTGKLNADSDRTGYRASAIYVDQFANDTVGVQLGFSHMTSPTQIKDARVWGYPGISATAPNPLAPLNGNAVIGGGEFKANSLTVERTGVTGALDFQPTDTFKATVDVFYSKFKDDQVQRGMELPLAWGDAQLQPTGATTSGGLVQTGTFNGVKAVLRSDTRTFEADVLATGFNAEQKWDKWTATFDASYNTISRESERMEIYAGTGRAPLGARDNIGFALTPGKFGAQFTPTLDYSSASLIQLTSAQGWGGDVVPGGQDGYVNRPSIDDDLWSARFDIDRELDGPITNVKVGVNYSSRDKSFYQEEFYLGLRANQAAPNNVSVAIPAQAVIGPTNLKWTGLGNVVAFDSGYLLANNLYRFIPCPRVDCLVNRWDLSEDVWTGMARADFETQLGKINLTGNAGVQVIRTDQNSVGPAALSFTQVGIRDDGAKYTDVLPSLNLIFSPENDDHKFRLSFSKQMARARPDQLRASLNVSYTPGLAGSNNINNSPWGGNGGNPRLKPWMANAVDAQYEYYFGGTGYFAVAAFYKDLKTYIYNRNVLADFTGAPISGGPQPVLRQGFISAPDNGEGGTLKGIEVTGSFPFELLSPALEGFGVTANVGYTETNIEPNGPGSNRPLEGYSKWTPQGTAYYEKDGFSARVSVSHRSKFVAEVRGFGESRDFRRGKGETLVDGQISYEFQDGMLDGLTILLQGYNLTNEPFVTYDNNDPNQVINYQEFGSRYLLGASYRF